MGTSNEPKTLECKPATSGGSKIDVCSPTTLCFFPEVAQMGLYDDACYPLAVLHWKNVIAEKTWRRQHVTKKMRDVGSKATTRTNSEMGLNHGISTSTLIGMQLQNQNINQTT